MVEVRYLVAADKFIMSLESRYQSAITADRDQIAEMGFKAPVSAKSITGKSPMWEVKNGGYRTFFFIDNRVLWVLHSCKKQDQKHGMRLATERMKTLRGR